MDPGLLLASHQGMLSENNLTTFRLINYPGVELEPDTKMIRCAPHTDYGSFTMTFQDSEGGLEVKFRNIRECNAVKCLEVRLGDYKTVR